MIDDGNQSMRVQSRTHYPTVIEDLKLGMLAGEVILHAVEDRASLDCVNRPRIRFCLLSGLVRVTLRKTVFRK